MYNDNAEGDRPLEDEPTGQPPVRALASTDERFSAVQPPRREPSPTDVLYAAVRELERIGAREGVLIRARRLAQKAASL